MSAHPHIKPASRFPCGHERTPENTRPNGPQVKCRICDQTRGRRYKKEMRDLAKDGRRVAELETENAWLRRELDATIHALIEARAASGIEARSDETRSGSAEGESPVAKPDAESPSS